MSSITLHTSDNTADSTMIVYDRQSTTADNCNFYYPCYPEYPRYIPVPYKEPLTRDQFKDWLLEEKIKSLEERVKSLEAEKEAWSKKKKK